LLQGKAAGSCEGGGAGVDVEKLGKKKGVRLKKKFKKSPNGSEHETQSFTIAQEKERKNPRGKKNLKKWH